MSTPCTLDKAAKIRHISELSKARMAYVRAVYVAEKKWQTHVCAVDLAKNGLVGFYNTETTYAQAEEARHAIRLTEKAVAARVSECRAVGLELGLDHLTETMVTAA